MLHEITLKGNSTVQKHGAIALLYHSTERPPKCIPPGTSHKRAFREGVHLEI